LPTRSRHHTCISTACCMSHVMEKIVQLVH
jgi:hypothetical protein